MSTFTFAPGFTYDDVTKTLSVDNINIDNNINIDGVNVVMKRLSSTTVNLQTLTGQTLYTVPSGEIAIITNIICRGFTANLNKNFTIGFNSPTFNDVVAYPTYESEVLSSTIGNCLILNLTKFQPGSDGGSLNSAKIQNHAEGTAGNVLKLLMALANTAPGTMIVDVFGYLVSA